MSTKPLFKDIERIKAGRVKRMAEPKKPLSQGHKRAKDKRAAKRDALRAQGLLVQKPKPTEKPDTSSALYDHQGRPFSRDALLRKDGSPRKRPKKNSSDAGQPIPGSRA